MTIRLNRKISHFDITLGCGGALVARTDGPSLAALYATLDRLDAEVTGLAPRHVPVTVWQGAAS